VFNIALGKVAREGRIERVGVRTGNTETGMLACADDLVTPAESVEDIIEQTRRSLGTAMRLGLEANEKKQNI